MGTERLQRMLLPTIRLTAPIGGRCFSRGAGRIKSLERSFEMLAHLNKAIGAVAGFDVKASEIKDISEKDPTLECGRGTAGVSAMVVYSQPTTESAEQKIETLGLGLLEQLSLLECELGRTIGEIEVNVIPLPDKNLVAHIFIYF